MTAAAAFLIFFIVVAVLIAIVFAVGRIGSSGVSRDQRRELREARTLIREIEKTARQYRSLDNNFAEVIIDMIDQSEMKELQ